MNDIERPHKILTDYYVGDTEINNKCENNICFGIDEYFLNNILFKYLIKKNLSFCYYHSFDLSRFYYYKHPNYIKNNINIINIPFNEYINIFNNYLKEIGLNKYSFKFIDSNIYIDKDYKISIHTSKITTKFMEIYAKKIITLLHKLMKNKDYRIYNKYQLYSLKLLNYKKYFMLKYIHFINSNNKDIIIDYIKYPYNFIKSIQNI